jgi:DNA-binding MarR family transcriptional regulator
MAGEATLERIGHVLTKVCELRHRRMHELLDGLGLYRGQPSMLRALWMHDGSTQSELADQLQRCPATITKMVQRMERAGFVKRKPDPSDERLSRVCLTDAGRGIQSAVEGVWRTFDEQAFAGFSEDEITRLHGLLLRVSHNIEGAPGCK